MPMKLIHIPLSKTDFDIELNTIYEIAENNGYTNMYINKILNGKLRHKNNNLIYVQPSPETKDKTYRKLAYIGQTSIKIARNFKTHDIQTAFYNKSNLKTFLVNNKIQNVDKMLNSGIYKINCNDCK